MQGTAVKLRPTSGGTHVFVSAAMVVEGAIFDWTPIRIRQELSSSRLPDAQSVVGLLPPENIGHVFLYQVITANRQCYKCTKQYHVHAVEYCRSRLTTISMEL